MVYSINSELKKNNLPLKLALFVFVFGFLSCNKEAKYVPVSEGNIFVSANEIPDSYFLGENNCKTCHQKEFKDWQGSHHDKAMQLADSISVLADFNDYKFTSQGVTSHFYKKDTDFYVNTEGPDGKNHDYKIVYTFGFTPFSNI